MIKNNLIITADDFGLCKSVNDAIINAYINNNITNVSILVNTPGFLDAANYLHRYKNLGVGLHFTLNRNKSIIRNSTLCDSDGNFFSRKELFKKIFLGKINSEDIRAEFLSQLLICKENGLKINHFDSDNHIHFHPFIFFSLLPLIIKKFSLRCLNPLFLNFSHKKRLMKQLYFKTLNSLFSINNSIFVNSNDYFVSLYDICNTFNFGLDNYYKLIENIKNSKTVELMVHPYLKSKELEKLYPKIADKNFINNCYVENDILGKNKNIFNKTNYNLITFDDLRNLNLSSLAINNKQTHNIEEKNEI